MPTALASLGACSRGSCARSGEVAAVAGGHGGIRLEIEAPADCGGDGVGDSVAVSGCCLTAVSVDGGVIAFDAVPETLARTSLGGLARGARVNIEPALRAGEPLGGHYVQGHVDGVGRVRSVEDEGDGRRIWFDAPAELLPLRRREGVDHRRGNEPDRRRARRRTGSRSRSSRTRSPRRRSASSRPATP